MYVFNIDAVKGGDYKNVRTLVVTGSGQKTQVPPTIEEEVQSDGVGIFAKFRGTDIVQSQLHVCVYHHRSRW